MRHQAKPSHAPSAISIVPIPTIVSNAQCSIVLRRWPVLGRHGVEADHLRVGAPPDQERVEAGDPEPALDAVGGAAAVDVLGDVRGGLLHALHRRELDRLVLGDRARRGVADRELDRREDAGHRERDQQAEPVIAVAAPAQHPDRVDRRHPEARDQVRGQDHVRHLVGDRRVEDHLQRLDLRHVSRRGREPLRLVHPRVHGHHRERPAESRDHDRHAGPEVRPRAQALPPEDVDRDEDRLEEEADSLDREQHPEDLTEPPRELRPQQAELERQHRPRHRPHRERHRHHLRPATGQQQRVFVPLAQAAVVRDQHQRREPHAEARQDDVKAERERHLTPRRLQVRRSHREDVGQRHTAAPVIGGNLP